MGIGILATLLIGLVPVAAQDVAPQLSGRLDSSWVWAAADGQSTGLVTGWAGLVAGTRDVKSEVRLGITGLPVPAVDLDRAWVKFRFPGIRVATGLGRIGWGPGLVLIPGDLMFDSVDTPVNWQADDPREATAWLGDAWVSLGEEAYAEAQAQQNSVGVRVSAAPGGVTVEAATAWDRAAQVAKASLSTQFHFGVDWYATLRQDVPTIQPALSPHGSSGGAGAFGMWDLGEGLVLTSRHEVWATRPGAATAWKTYNDLILAFDAGWSLAARSLVASTPSSWTPSAEVRWAPLQNLSLYAVSTLNLPWVLSLGCTGKW
jgi:hypothetical protein